MSSGIRPMGKHLTRSMGRRVTAFLPGMHDLGFALGLGQGFPSLRGLNVGIEAAQKFISDCQLLGSLSTHCIPIHAERCQHFGRPELL